MPSMALIDGKEPAPGSKDWMRWFRNIACKKPFDVQGTSTDYSLQLAASIQNFLAARSASDGGLYNVQYWNGLPVHQIYGQRGAEPDQNQK